MHLSPPSGSEVYVCRTRCQSEHEETDIAESGECRDGVHGRDADEERKLVGAGAAGEGAGTVRPA